MVTVVIIGVCLVMALRVFSFCAAAVSEAYCSTYAVNILQEKLDEVEEEIIMAGGAVVSYTSEDVERGGRTFTVTMEITNWESPIVEPTEETEAEVETEGAEETEIVSMTLCEAVFVAEWGPSNKRKNIKVKTMFPAKTEMVNEYDI
ncbi:MAG: hypothetical protein ISS33_05920 [Candidatus Omnitrophica bacterium]|nr:hypothetical protein [Candidatus Omnitrophota bacterium]